MNHIALIVELIFAAFESLMNVILLLHSVYFPFYVRWIVTFLIIFIIDDLKSKSNILHVSSACNYVCVIMLTF